MNRVRRKAAWGGLALCCTFSAALGAEPSAKADLPTSQPAHSAASQPSDLAAPKTDGNDLSTLSLEDLMNVQVYSAAKHSQKASETPAAISVISQDDMRRSYFTTIPECSAWFRDWTWLRSMPISGRSAPVGSTTYMPTNSWS